MNAPRFLTLLGLGLSIATSSGCTYYFPHSLVASNIRTTPDPLTTGGKRVEAEVCGNRLFTIPFGPDPRMSAVMDALQAQVTNAIGFEDIRIDVSVVNYFLWISLPELYPGLGVPSLRRDGTPAEGGAQERGAGPSAVRGPLRGANRHGGAGSLARSVRAVKRRGARAGDPGNARKAEAASCPAFLV